MSNDVFNQWFHEGSKLDLDSALDAALAER
jgi:hypothetical protein